MKTSKKLAFISQQAYLYLRVTDILKFYFVHILKVCFVFEKQSQASAYEKQGHVTIACLVTKFRGYRHGKGPMPLTK